MPVRLLNVSWNFSSSCVEFNSPLHADDASSAAARLKHELPGTGREDRHLSGQTFQNLGSGVDRTVQEGTLLPLLSLSISCLSYPHAHASPSL